MALSVKFKNMTVSIGDNVIIAQRIKEGEKERIQNYSGLVIAIKGNRGQKTVTVRKIAAGGIGVEKIIPVDLPSVEQVRVTRRAIVNRSKLYYLRKRSSKAALKLKERNIKQKIVKDVEKPKKKPVKKTSAKKSSKKPRKSGGKRSVRISAKK